MVGSDKIAVLSVCFELIKNYIEWINDLKLTKETINENDINSDHTKCNIYLMEYQVLKMLTKYIVKIIGSEDYSLMVKSNKEKFNKLDIIHKTLCFLEKYSLLGIIGFNMLWDNKLATNVLQLLIEREKLSEALEYSELCNLSSSKVYLKMIEAVIYDLNFPDARKLFAIMKEQNPFMNDTENRIAVDGVINIIENMEYDLSITSARSNLRKIQLKYFAKHQTTNLEKLIESRKELEAKKAFDRIKFEEGCYYINNFGDELQIIPLYVRHDMLEHACRLIFSRKLGEHIFITQILEKILGYEQKIKDLQQTIRKLDPNFDITTNYLFAIIKYLKEKNYWTELYSFNVFMKDYYKAGLRCIQWFIEDNDVKRKFHFLTRAEEHFIEAINIKDGDIISRKLGTTISGEIVADINKYLQHIPLQREVLESFPGLKDYHIFGDYDLKVELCKNLLAKESVYVITLVDVLNLDLKKIIKIAFEYMVAKEDTKGIEDLVQILVEWQKKKLIPLRYEIKPAEWDSTLLMLINSLKNVDEDFVREKLISRITSENHRLMALKLIGESEKAVILEQSIKSQE